MPLPTVLSGALDGARDTHRHRVRVRLHCGEQGSGLYLLVADVTVTPVILHGVISPEEGRHACDIWLDYTGTSLIKKSPPSLGPP